MHFKRSAECSKLHFAKPLQLEYWTLEETLVGDNCLDIIQPMKIIMYSNLDDDVIGQRHGEQHLLCQY